MAMNTATKLAVTNLYNYAPFLDRLLRTHWECGWRWHKREPSSSHGSMSRNLIGGSRGFNYRASKKGFQFYEDIEEVELLLSVYEDIEEDEKIVTSAYEDIEEVENIFQSAFGSIFGFSFYSSKFYNRTSWNWRQLPKKDGKAHGDENDDDEDDDDGNEDEEEDEENDNDDDDDDDDDDDGESGRVETDSRKDRIALGLSGSGPLSLKDVKNAYRACALQWHPDRHTGSSKAIAEKKFKLCNAAYESLRDKLVANKK